MPSLGPRSGWGGPLRWRHIEELQAEDETETRSIKHKRALRCVAGGSAWVPAAELAARLAASGGVVQALLSPSATKAAGLVRSEWDRLEFGSPPGVK